MKIYFYLLVFLFFLAAGYLIRRGYRRRKMFFENLLSFCNHLLVEISFSKNTVTHVIDEYADGYAPQFRAVLTEYKNLIDARTDITREKIDAIMWPKLKRHERGVVADFFYGLGRHGPSEEAEKIENKKIQFDEFYNASAQSVKREASIYFKICIIVGVGAVILML